MAVDAQPQPSPEWDESQCTAALAHLERLQAQLDDLRLTIPRVIRPFTAPPAPSMYRAFSDNLTASQNDIKAFRTQWHSQDTQSVLDHARKSLARNKDLSKSAEVGKYGWVEKERKERERGKKMLKEKESGTGVGEGERLGEGDVGRILDEWKTRKGYEKIGLKREDGDKDLTITFVAGSWKHRFHILIQQEETGSHKLHVECLGTGATQLAITRCMMARPKLNDLRYLLDMIAAYKTVKGTTCAKCGNMLDSHALGTVARRSRDVVDTEGKTEVVWEAFHESCLG
ncbi:hypothetical protein CC80DRAFT_142899 [Byssothecium circinans]|uniref:Mediator complex subunit 27 n=1 Tax=Byssothecium circinans TaxID=147558 RepID=A0A6A5TXG0_9PLEO|nr:hypothetical protein CC80DRAFT_142899 [Byssothecium circinans]